MAALIDPSWATAQRELSRGLLWQLGICLLVPLSFSFSSHFDEVICISGFFGLLLPMLLAVLWYLPWVIYQLWEKNFRLALKTSALFILLFSTNLLLVVLLLKVLPGPPD